VCVTEGLVESVLSRVSVKGGICLEEGGIHVSRYDGGSFGESGF
jgi:hypothetical protein